MSEHEYELLLQWCSMKKSYCNHILSIPLLKIKTWINHNLSFTPVKHNIQRISP